MNPVYSIFTMNEEDGTSENDSEEEEMTTILRFKSKNDIAYKECIKCGQRQPAVYRFCWSGGKRFKKGGMPW